MKLVNFSVDGPILPGVTDGTRVAALAGRIENPPTDMIGLISSWDRLADQVRAIDSYDYPLESVRLHAPVLRPGKIFAIGLNYADHVAEGGMETPAHQIWFTKPGTSVNGPYDPIQRPLVSTKLDYEAELVYVIGRRCKHVSHEDAMKAIFGYCAGNDVSVRDWQLQTSQYVLGKSFDTHAPFGPWIVTADAVDPSNLGIRCYVNRELRQNSSTRYLIFDCAAQIAHLSQAMTLEPGDVIFTGTSSGVGAARKPPVFLRAGDRVRVEIDEIGHIESEVVDERAVVNLTASDQL